ncbi:hypothetical protein IFM89_030749 [Coptis chinensis]|uniref:Myb-like domain-containing protein n=1 Tax=Coptis chinensis TaxID=261450 RepID=A0A835MJL9_9MAGN|nr:hypothetical protein IFM89_030749 [Coptis chinensis]
MQNTPENIDKKTGLKEVLSGGIQVGKSGKQGRQSLVVIVSQKNSQEEEVCFKSSQESARMPKGRKRVGSVICPFSTPGKGKEKKKRNISCGTNGNCDVKEICGIREVNKSTSTDLRLPLTSIENISPKKTQLVCHGKSSKSLVEPKNEVSKCVKPISGSRKETEDRSTSSQRGEKCGAHGWPQDQESALQRAYFTANPSPHFWKKISKLVPGKSGQDCFDKFHSDTITPPQPRSCSRAKRTDLSPLGHFSLSASKLLEPAKLNVKKSGGNKRTKCLAQKTVRHLLQKQNSVNQGYKADIFSILEPTATLFTHSAPEPETPSAPECSVDKQSFRENCTQRSLSAHKKPLSRFRGTSKAPLESPAVLKQIKNISLHEKYIDRLHSWDTRRAAGGRQCTTIKEDTEENVQRMDVIKAAKNALVSDATDMINKFKHIEANALNNSEDFDDGDEYQGSDGQEGDEDEF